MSLTLELLEKLFRPAKVLLLCEEQTADVERLLAKICACEIDREPKHSNYDLIVVATSNVGHDVLDKLKNKGPIVLGSVEAAQSAKAALKAKAVALVPGISEESLAEAFRLLKIKTRTPDVIEALAAFQRASDKSFAESACVSQAV